jgi:alpha,alpha-trehalase
MPSFTQVATPEQARFLKNHLEQRFLRDGGLLTTPYRTGQQWDAPNGWAPLQFLSIQGLMNYGYDTLARTIAGRWMQVNEKVFEHTGKMMEKYNVEDIHLESGGGEYPSQDGFGWSNGVYLKLYSMFRK